MRASDEEQYVEYVGAAVPGLHRLAYLLCGDPHRADDIVQTTITRLYVHWNRACRADHLDRYVRAMLLRCYLAERRLRWATVKLVGAPSDTPMPAAAPGPDVETSMVVRTALARVPPRQRAVLILRFLYDLPVAEVAALLDCSEGNVKSQTSHGLAALRRLLGENALVTLGRK